MSSNRETEWWQDKENDDPFMFSRALRFLDNSSICEVVADIWHSHEQSTCLSTFEKLASMGISRCRKIIFDSGEYFSKWEKKKNWSLKTEIETKTCDFTSFRNWNFHCLRILIASTSSKRNVFNRDYLANSWWT